MIECKELCYAYHTEPVLNHVSFSVPEGAAVLLEGDNGAGKSTLLKIVNGLLFPQQGEYFFCGQQITADKMREHKFSKWYHQKIGFIWQNPEVQLFCNHVEEEIAFGPRQMELSEEEVQRRTDDAIRLLSLEHLRFRAPYHLSGGEKKKTAIASVLVMNPEVWTLDEPFASLDKKSQQWLVQFLLELKKAGKTILLSTHEASVCEELLDFRIVLDPSYGARVDKV